MAEKQQYKLSCGRTTALKAIMTRLWCKSLQPVALQG